MTLGNIVKTTTNSRTYKRALKWLREANGDIFCSRCPYHGGENYHNRSTKSWKDTTKRKRQYKGE